MITKFRHFTDSWIARVFFIIMAVSFVGWGVSGDIFRLMGPPSWVAKVGGQTIEIPAFQTEYQRALAQQTRDQPAGQEPPAGLRRQVGQQTLNRMVAQAALSQELASLHIVTPDAAVAATVRSMPAFRGSDGKFSKPMFDAAIRNNGFTEARFLEQLRSDITQQQLLNTLSGSIVAPDAEVKPLYESEFEKRSADTALFPLAAAPEPAAPDPAAQQRQHEAQHHLPADGEHGEHDGVADAGAQQRIGRQRPIVHQPGRREGRRPGRPGHGMEAGVKEVGERQGAQRQHQPERRPEGRPARRQMLRARLRV